jgi:hypothetical protein
MLITTVKPKFEEMKIQLGMEIPSYSCVMGRAETNSLTVNGYIDPLELLKSKLSPTADSGVLERIQTLLVEAQKHYDQNGNLLNPNDPEVKALGLPGKNGKILTLPQAELCLGSVNQESMPSFERDLRGELVLTDYLINWAFQKVGKELAAESDGILFSSDSKKLQSCSVGSVNVSLTAFVEFQGNFYLLGHKKSGDIMVQPGQVHGSLLPGGIFGGHMTDIGSHLQEDGKLPIAALSEALPHHAASKWGISKEQFESGIVMDRDNPIIISELVELGYFQFGYIAKSIDPALLEEMLLKESSKDPSLKMTELVLIPVGNNHDQEQMWTVTAAKDEAGAHLVMTPHDVINPDSFVGYARAIRDAAARDGWFGQVIQNNALSLEKGLPVKLKIA